MEYLLPIFGFLIGTVASMTGIGGGVFVVPLFTLVYAFAPAHAVGTSLSAIMFTAAASTINYARQKRIYYKTGSVLAVTTAPGALLGAYLTSIIPAKALGLIFGFFLILVGLRMTVDFNALRRMLFKSEITTRDEFACEKELLVSKRKLVLGATLSFFGGLTSGLLGIGGGVLVVAIMNLVMTIPIHMSVATSMFTMIFTSISGVAQHYSLGNIQFEYVLPLALGTVLGAQLGARTSK